MVREIAMLNICHLYLFQKLDHSGSGVWRFGRASNLFGGVRPWCERGGGVGLGLHRTSQRRAIAIGSGCRRGAAARPLHSRTGNILETDRGVGAQRHLQTLAGIGANSCRCRSNRSSRTGENGKKSTTKESKFKIRNKKRHHTCVKHNSKLLYSPSTI